MGFVFFCQFEKGRQLLFVTLLLCTSFLPWFVWPLPSEYSTSRWADRLLSLVPQQHFLGVGSLCLNKNKDITVLLSVLLNIWRSHIIIVIFHFFLLIFKYINHISAHLIEVCHRRWRISVRRRASCEVTEIWSPWGNHRHASTML